MQMNYHQLTDELVRTLTGDPPRCASHSDFGSETAYGEDLSGNLPRRFSPSELSQSLWTHPS